MVIRLTIVVFLLSALYLQYKVWFSDVGYFAAISLEAEVERQQRRAERLAQRNKILTAEVLALKDGLQAVEARARSDLGMIKEGETFYLVSEDGG